jgi:hypothetical protein
MTIDSYPKSKKRIKIKNEYESIHTYFDICGPLKIKFKILGHYHRLNQEEALLKIDDILNQNKISRSLNSVFKAQIESILAKLLHSTHKNTVTKLIDSSDFYKDKEFRFFFSNLLSETQIKLIEKSQSNLKYIKDLKPRTVEYLSKIKPIMIWDMKRYNKLSWTDILNALYYPMPDQKTRRQMYEKINTEMPSDIIERLIDY